MPKKKTKKKIAEPSLVKKEAAEPLPEKSEKEELRIGMAFAEEAAVAKPALVVPVDNDVIGEEIDGCEHIARVVNIKHNTPGITTIKKVVEYDYVSKKMKKAEYIIGVK